MSGYVPNKDINIPMLMNHLVDVTLGGDCSGGKFILLRHKSTQAIAIGHRRVPHTPFPYPYVWLDMYQY